MKNVVAAQQMTQYLVVTVFIIFSLPFLPVFAENETSTPSSTPSMYEGTDRAEILTPIGTWFNQFFTRENLTSNILITITRVMAIPKTHEVLITWNASNLATGRVYYSTTTPLTMSSSTLWVPASEYGNYANSKANIRNLHASTTYYYMVLIHDLYGNRAISKEMSFVTK